jgi:hypothetical protein
MATSHCDNPHCDNPRGENGYAYTELTVPYRVASELSEDRSGRPSEAEIAAIALALWKLLPPAGTKDTSGGSWPRVGAFESVSQRL